MNLDKAQKSKGSKSINNNSVNQGINYHFYFLTHHPFPPFFKIDIRFLPVYLVAIDFNSNSPQDAIADHSDLILSTFFTTTLQLNNSKFHWCLVIALHPSSLTPEPPEIFCCKLLSTLFTRGQPPSQMFRQPLSPILFQSELISNDHLTKSLPTSPRPPWRGVCSPSSLSYCHLHRINITQLYMLEFPPVSSAEELAGQIPHLVVA